MSDEKKIRPRITMLPLTSAGGDAAEVRADALRGLPFDPHTYPVGDALIEALTGVDTVRTLNDLQAFDTRTTAATYYERRIKELATQAEED